MSSVKRLSSCITWGVLVFMLGGVILAYIQGRSGPPLQPWHTEQLSAEFTAGKTDEIRTFDDYLRLEDVLFRQLEAQVYAQTSTGPKHALDRYSAGSAADPLNHQPNWNHSFELATDAPVGGVLLLHGMSDSPYTYRALGQALNANGFWVIGLRLPGHGTAPSGLIDVSWRDMAAAVQLGMAHLAAMAGRESLHIVGYSTGAPLALDFALNALQGDVSPVPASLLLISPAIGLHPAAALAKWKRRLASLPGLGGLAWLQILPEFDPYKYNSFTTNAGEQVHSVTRSVAERMDALPQSDEQGRFPPTLVFKSTVDATVSTDALVDNFFAHLTPNRHELVLFDINRSAVNSSLLVSDPGPLTERMMDNTNLPFSVTLVTNEGPESVKVVAHKKGPFSAEVSRIEPLDLAWPRGVISLSHVALPFPPDDPLYGQRPPDNEDVLFLGEMSIQGERGLLKLPTDWLLRLRYNPFYDYLERRVLEWVKTETS